MKSSRSDRKPVRQLGKQPGRHLDRQGGFVAAPEVEESYLYGRRAVAELLKHRVGKVQRVLTAEGSQLPSALKSLVELRSSEGLHSEVVPRGELDRLFPDAVHQGICAQLKPAPPVELKTLIEHTVSPLGNGLLVVLDQITDPRNLGGILRVAEATGVDGIIVPQDNAAGLTPVARKASVGASELVPFCQVTNLRRALDQLRERGIWLVGAAGEPGMDEEPAGAQVSTPLSILQKTIRPQNLFETEIPTPVAFVLGSEGRGLRKLTREACDLLIEIPMRGCIESLNVNQASSVILYEFARRAQFWKSGLK